MDWITHAEHWLPELGVDHLSVYLVPLSRCSGVRSQLKVLWETHFT